MKEKPIHNYWASSPRSSRAIPIGPENRALNPWVDIFPFIDSAGRQAPLQLPRLNLQPLQDRLGDRFREEFRDLGAHFV